MIKNKFCKKFLSVLFLYFMHWGIIFAPDAYLSSQDTGDFSELDNTVYSLNMGVDFTSGETISSSEMNNKFNRLKDLLEQILNNNRAELNIPDNISYINKSGQSPIIIFASETGGNGNFQGLIGANNKCAQNSNMITNLNNNGKICDNIKAILATSDTSYEQIYDESKGPFYDPKGGLLSNTWSEFNNLNVLDKNRFGLYMEEIWKGGLENNCNNWNDNSNTTPGNFIMLSTEPGVISYEYSGNCSEYKALLCACE